MSRFFEIVGIAVIFPTLYIGWAHAERCSSGDRGAVIAAHSQSVGTNTWVICTDHGLRETYTYPIGSRSIPYRSSIMKAPYAGYDQLVTKFDVVG
jgi:hypothetical protein